MSEAFLFPKCVGKGVTRWTRNAKGARVVARLHRCPRALHQCPEHGSAGELLFRPARTRGHQAGHLADLVRLDQDPLKVDPMKIKDLKVLATYKEGKSIFSAK